jgi:hypothetical protein
MNCPNPIDATVLADYWLAALSPAEEEPVEQHLFLCDSCGGRLRELIALAAGVREVARSGVLNLIVSDDLLDRLRATGARIREYSVPSGGSVQCTVAADDDILIGRGTLIARLTAFDEQGGELSLGEYTFHHTRSIPGPPGW